MTQSNVKKIVSMSFLKPIPDAVGHETLDLRWPAGWQISHSLDRGGTSSSEFGGRDQRSAPRRCISHANCDMKVGGQHDSPLHVTTPQTWGANHGKFKRELEKQGLRRQGYKLARSKLCTCANCNTRLERGGSSDEQNHHAELLREKAFKDRPRGG